MRWERQAPGFRRGAWVRRGTRGRRVRPRAPGFRPEFPGSCLADGGIDGGGGSDEVRVPLELRGIYAGLAREREAGFFWCIFFNIKAPRGHRGHQEFAHCRRVVCKADASQRCVTSAKGVGNLAKGLPRVVFGA
jgi:hypothetical protein